VPRLRQAQPYGHAHNYPVVNFEIRNPRSRSPPSLSNGESGMRLCLLIQTPANTFLPLDSANMSEPSLPLSSAYPNFLSSERNKFVRQTPQQIAHSVQTVRYVALECAPVGQMGILKRLGKLGSREFVANVELPKVVDRFTYKSTRALRAATPRLRSASVCFPQPAG
jgi:hypothetical protein